MTPRSRFFDREGLALKLVLAGTTVLFLVLMVWTWVASEKARPVMLDLTTGQPVSKRPPL